MQGKLCAKSSQYVFVVYDDGSYKMTGLSLEVAKGSGTPLVVWIVWSRCASLGHVM